MRILVVEDEQQLAGHIAKALCHEGHLPSIVHEGEAALRATRAEAFDLVILDVMLPGCDGFEVLKRLRTEHTPSRVMMLTARVDIEARVRGLTLGADDYVAKPFAIRELLARVLALGRRFSAEPETTLRLGDLTLNVADHEVRRGSRRIGLSTREFTLLKTLLHEPGRIFTRDELCERVWEREHEYDTELVEVFMGRLRKKIDEPADTPVIHAVRHVGYTAQCAS